MISRTVRMPARRPIEATVTWFGTLSALAAEAAIPALSIGPVLRVARRVADADSLVALRAACWAYALVAVVIVLSRKRVGAVCSALVSDFQARSRQEYAALPVQPMRWFERLPLVGAVAIGAWAVILALVSTNTYLGMVQEDHLIENGSVVFWALGALAGVAGLAIGTRPSRPRTLVYLGLISFCVVCGGEEISWGQRVFDFTTPEFLAAVNKQNETNFHNVGSIALYEHAFFLLGLVTFWFLPRVLGHSRQMSNYFRSWDLPIVSTHLSRVYLVTIVTWVIVGIRFATLGFTRFSLFGYYNQADDEIFETMSAYCYATLMVLDVAARARERAADARTPAAAVANAQRRPSIRVECPASASLMTAHRR